MSKYKVGDKISLEAVIKNYDNRKGAKYYFVELRNGDANWLSEDELSMLETKTYEDGLDDAWELARKVSHMCLDDMNKCFDLEDLDKYGADMMLYEHYTPQQALAKIEAYEKSQQIQVGDVVRFKDSKTEVLITSVARGLNGIHIQNDECGKVGEVNSGICREHVEKTGRHIDIEHLLEQIRGNEDDNR